MKKYKKPEILVIRQEEESALLGHSRNVAESKRRNALLDNVEPVGDDLNDFSELKDMKTYNPWED